MVEIYDITTDTIREVEQRDIDVLMHGNWAYGQVRVLAKTATDLDDFLDDLSALHKELMQRLEVSEHEPD